MSGSTQALVVYVDVDDTLIRSVGPKRFPIPRVVDHIRKLRASGAELHCWSSGGPDYARLVAKEIGVEECFKAFLPKPNVLIDDQPLSEQRLCRFVHPLTIEHQNVSEYWNEIKAAAD